MKRSGTSRRPNVTTSSRRDVVTSQRRDVGSTIVQSQQATTSRRLNVAMLQCRDVSASSAFSALKSNGGADFGASGNGTSQGTEIRAGVTGSRRRARDLCFPLFWILDLMFMILDIDIFSVIMF